MDKLNSLSYAYHYRNLDSAYHYALTASYLSDHYDDGHAEALNNLAFVSIIKMDYDEARHLLDSIPHITDNQLELLVGYIQQMRLCQRKSENREFYDCREKALRALQRINEERASLSARQLARLVYAESEWAIVNSTYYFYVGLERQSLEAIAAMPDELEQDTAQFLNYLYNVGAGGIIVAPTDEEINQREFDHLMRCFLLAQQGGYAYFAANSLEGLAEHFISTDNRQFLIENNLPATKFINPEAIADDLLPIWLADNALATFREYGDTYQIAGAFRTLASCYMAQGDYESALFNLEQALSDSLIFQAPDLVASIREQLSVVYAAIDDKPESDLNRNLYLDLQEQTRQDRWLEARASQLEQSLSQQSRLLWAVLAAIVVLVAILWYFYWRKKHHLHDHDVDTNLRDREEELEEQLAIMRQRVVKGERRLLEQRAKVSLVNGITPLIDRMIHEVRHLGADDADRMEYIRELTDEINQQNQLLTHWIQLRQGELSLHIETFPLQDLFDLLQRSQHSFAMHQLTLDVQPTEAYVKADRVLTLFMLNTLADNARKFTKPGGQVTISAKETDSYVELSVSDTGIGMDEQQTAQAFEHKITSGHGFGLLNCKGIIEKYRKISQIFSVCLISVESKLGDGSRFFFRLPKGIAKTLVILAMMTGFHLNASSITLHASTKTLDRAAVYADSAYFSNINGTYERTLRFADSCYACLNAHYLEQYPESADTLLSIGDLSTTPPEIMWLRDSVDTNYDMILDIRNESAVAALALHEWTVYQYNNRIYTSLFKERSADSTLADYCRKMQQSQTNKQVAILLLILIFTGILVALSWQLMRSFTKSVRRQQEFQDQLDLMADELQRLTLEENALHVSNAVLDNTLSALKHETMYYPSRIRQLLDQGDINSLGEVVGYYRELYGLLSAQSLDQASRFRLHLQPLDHGLLADANLLDYLFNLLKKESGLKSLHVDYTFSSDGHYVECRVRMPSAFTLQSQNISYLLCRQIVRDHGEATSRRACAITSDVTDGANTVIIRLPRAKRGIEK